MRGPSCAHCVSLRQPSHTSLGTTQRNCQLIGEESGSTQMGRTKQTGCVLHQQIPSLHQMRPKHFAWETADPRLSPANPGSTRRKVVFEYGDGFRGQRPHWCREEDPGRSTTRHKRASQRETDTVRRKNCIVRHMTGRALRSTATHLM